MVRSPAVRTAHAATLALAVVLAAACGQSAGGDGYQLSAGQLTPAAAPASGPSAVLESPTTTEAPEAPAEAPPAADRPAAVTSVVATAKGAQLQAWAQKPDGGSATGDGFGKPAASGEAPTFTPVVASAAGVGPIPREGLNTAPYLEKTAEGWLFGNPTSFGNPLDVLVVADEGEWLKVLLPVRPNHTEGWIRAADVDLASHQYRLELRLSTHTLTAYNGSDVIAQTRVVTGRPNSPTPTGRFYVNEKVKGDGGAYGPWILSTNGYSETLDEFDGGLPVIAFHGTNQPNLIGTQASNGCVRMPNDVVTKLHDQLPAGTPIDILA